MCRAIDAAYEVDEVKDIRDKARAWEVYSQQAHNVEAERRACGIRLRAERRAGQLLKEREKAKPPGDNNMGKWIGRAALPKELGVSKQQSSDWQKLADTPDEEFEAAFTANNQHDADREGDRPPQNGQLGPERSAAALPFGGWRRAGFNRRAALQPPGGYRGVWTGWLKAVEGGVKAVEGFG